MWSIGIYSGDSLFNLTPSEEARNPVLTCRDVNDVSAEFVADPFMISVSGIWYMFFEVLNQVNNMGEIGLATSDNGFDWTYQQIVLREPFHLSYPYVFKFKDDYYLIPETLEVNSVSLYKAVLFPTLWSYVCPLVDEKCADPSIFYYDDKWWLFACTTPYQHDSLRLYYAEDLSGEWKEHPMSPIVDQNNRIARPAGRVMVLDDKIIRFSQDCFPVYGTQVRVFEISRLTTTTYFEVEHECSPLLAPSGNGWNAMRMHHIDPHPLSDGKWFACVDGFNKPIL